MLCVIICIGVDYTIIVAEQSLVDMINLLLLSQGYSLAFLKLLSRNIASSTCKSLTDVAAEPPIEHKVEFVKTDVDRPLYEVRLLLEVSADRSQSLSFLD